MGLALPIDGSRDSELRIKGFTAQEMEIGNWHLGLEGTMDTDAILRDEDAEGNNDNSAVDFVYREEDADV